MLRKIATGFVCVACVMLSLFAITSRPAFSQTSGGETLRRISTARNDTPAAAVTNNQAPKLPARSSEDKFTYLPIVTRAITVAQQWAYSATCDNTPDATSADPATFGYGLRELYLLETIQGANGKSFKVEWTIDGNRITDLDETGAVPSNAYNYSSVIMYGVGGNCGSAVPRGTYSIKFYIDGQLFKQGQAVIR